MAGSEGNIPAAVTRNRLADSRAPRPTRVENPEIGVLYMSWFNMSERTLGALRDKSTLQGSK